MAGIIELDADSNWKVASWVYCGVMAESLAHLNSEPVVAQSIQQSIDSNVLYFSFEKLSPGDGQLVVTAIEHVLDDARSKGAGNWAQPEFYGAFVAHFRELV